MQYGWFICAWPHDKLTMNNCGHGVIILGYDTAFCNEREKIKKIKREAYNRKRNE